MVHRRYALVVLGVGLLVVVLGLLKVLPGTLVSTGAGLAFFGLVLTGLSFVPAPTPSPDATPPLSAFERIAGLFYEPTRVFRNLRAHPRWLVALLIVSLVSFIYTTAFTKRITPERIIEFTTQKVIESGWVPENQLGEVERSKEEQIREAKNPVKIAGGAFSQVAFTFIFMAAIAGIYMLGVLVFGGRINFRQALSVAAHAAVPPVVISRLLSLVILYIKDPADIHPVLGSNGLVRDNLGILFSPSAHPVLFTAASFIGVLSFYGLWLVATGLKNAGERVSSTAAWSTAIAVWLIGFLFLICLAAIAPGFIA